MIGGGFRYGSKIVIALALGASGVLLFRAYAFALAAQGEAGVAKAIESLANEITITPYLMGLSSISELKEIGAECMRNWSKSLSSFDVPSQPIGVKLAISRCWSPE